MIRSLSHLCLLPAMLLVFQETRGQADRDEPVMVEAEGIEIRPATAPLRGSNRRIETQLRTRSGTIYGIAMPFEEVVMRMQSRAPGRSGIVDLREPVAGTPLPPAGTPSLAPEAR